MVSNSIIRKDLSMWRRIVFTEIVILFIILLNITSQSVFADEISGVYHENDYGKLRAFLELPNGSTKNGYYINRSYDPDDPTTWTGVRWTDDDTKRVSYIGWASSSYSLVGDLDLSGFTEVYNLSLNSNELTSIDISGCINLEYLYCCYNQISNLTIFDCPNLWEISCHNNKLTSLEVSDCEGLVVLNCCKNELSALDLGNVHLLEEFYCFNNKLTEIELSNNTLLEKLDCSNNQLSELDLSNNSLLEEVYCSNNQLSELDLSNNILLKKLACSNNQLSELDLSNSPELEELNCGFNLLTELDLSNNRYLKSFCCDSNQITELDLSKSTRLEILTCSTNSIKNLDFDNNYSLKEVYCQSNQLTELALNKNRLEILDCSQNQLLNLDLSGSNRLYSLDCSNNQLSTLYLEYIYIDYLDCSSNKLRELFVGNVLEEFDCSSNQLSFYDLSLQDTAEYLYSPQAEVSIGVEGKITAQSFIDLSPEAMIEGEPTEFIWYDDNGVISPTICDNGQFSFDESFSGQTIYCELKNAKFPDLILKTTEVVVSPLPPEITKQPEDFNGSIGDSANFYIEAITPKGEIHYQWQVSIDKGHTWENIEGETEESITIAEVTEEESEKIYRCVVKTYINGLFSAPEYSIVVGFNLVPKPEITTQPVDKTIESGKNVIFSIEIEAISEGVQSFQWQVSIDEGKTWADIEGAIENNYLLESVNFNDNGKQYRCLVLNTLNGINSTPVYSEQVVLTVLARPTIITHPVREFYSSVGGNMSIEVKGFAVNGVIAYQWQVYNKESRVWEDIEGAIEEIYTIENISDEENENNYRCAVMNTLNGVYTTPIYSRESTLYLVRLPVINHQPEGCTVSVGETATFNVEAESIDGGTLTYQWEKFKSLGGYRIIIEGAIESEITIEGVSLEDNNWQYSCKIINTRGDVSSLPVKSYAAVLRVVQEPVIKTEPEDCTVSVGDIASFRVEAESIDEGILSYQWEVSSAGEDTWTLIEGAIESELIIEGVTSDDNGSKYRCKVVNTLNEVSSAPVISDSAVLTIKTYGITFIKPDSDNDENNPVNINSGSLVIARINGDLDRIDKVFIRVDDDIEEDYPLSGDTIYYLLPSNLTGNEYHSITIKLISDTDQELATESVQFYWEDYRRGFGFGRFDFGEEE